MGKKLKSEIASQLWIKMMFMKEPFFFWLFRQIFFQV